MGLADRKDKYITFKINDRNGYKKIIMTLGVKVMLGECFECEGPKHGDVVRRMLDIRANSP